MTRELTVGHEAALRGVGERDVDAAPEVQAAHAPKVSALEALARATEDHEARFAGLLERVDQTMYDAKAARGAALGELARIRAAVLLGEADEDAESVALEEVARLQRVVERCRDGRPLLESRIDTSRRALAPLKRRSADADDAYGAARESARRRLAGV